MEGRYGLKGDRAVFEFKYVPELGRVGTEMGPEEEQRKGVRRDVEWRSARTLGLAVVGLGVVVWVGVRVARGVMGLVV